jgi:hypothetical protein
MKTQIMTTVKGTGRARYYKYQLYIASARNGQAALHLFQKNIYCTGNAFIASFTVDVCETGCTVMKVTNKMQLYGLIYFSLSVLHVSGDIFAHHQEHLTVFTVSGSIHPGCCQQVSLMITNRYCKYSQALLMMGENIARSMHS